MTYFVIIFAVLFFYLAWRRLDWAVMAVIAALPAYLIRFSILGLPSTLLEVMIWLVFLVWLIKNYKKLHDNFLNNFKNDKKLLKVRYPFDWEIVVLLFLALAAVFTAGFSNAAFGIFKAYFFEPILFFIVVLNVMKGKPPLPPFGRGAEKILWSLAASALAVSLMAIYQKITGQFIANPFWAAVETRRVVSFFGYPNAVGLYLGPIVLVLTGWLISLKKDYKAAIIGLTIVFSVLAIYFAKSKGALAGVVAGLVVFGLLAGKKIRLVTIGIVVLAIAGVLAYAPARELAIDTVQFKTLSGQIRMVGWQETWKMLKDGRLITGAGLANFQSAVAPYHAEGFFIKNDDPDWLKKIRSSADYRKQMWQPLEIYLYPHNIIFNFWSELGLAGLLLFIWIMIKYFIMGGQNFLAAKNNFLNLGLIAAMAAIIVHGQVDVPYFKNDLAVLFWLLVALMSLINLNNKYEKLKIG